MSSLNTQLLAQNVSLLQSLPDMKHLKHFEDIFVITMICLMIILVMTALVVCMDNVRRSSHPFTNTEIKIRHSP